MDTSTIPLSAAGKFVQIRLQKMTMTEAELQRCRRDFIAMFRNKTHLTSQSTADTSHIAQLFAAFIDSRFSPNSVSDKSSDLSLQVDEQNEK